MRKNRKIILFLFLLSFGFLFFLGFNSNFLSNNPYAKNNLTIPQSSATHFPIYIDGDAALDSFCSGNGTDGTEINPHIIEDYEIDAGESGVVMEIRNTNRFLIIRNLVIKNSGDSGNDAGIQLISSSNIVITGSDISNNNHGIFLQFSHNNTLTGNIFKNNGENSVYLVQSDNNTVSQNEFLNNDDNAIMGNGGNFNNISNNIISNNQRAIYLIHSDYWVIENNIIDNTGYYGINFNQADNNLIISNSIINNVRGIYFIYANNNQIINNLITTSPTGIFLVDSGNNSIWGNDLLNNDIQATNIRPTPLNVWNNDYIGNHWGDYQINYPNGVENEDLWSIPYQIGSDQDNYPLVNRYTNNLNSFDFTCSNTNPVLNRNVVQFFFTGKILSTIKTFQWNFGDGTANSTERDPTHVYTSFGNYSVTLTASNSTDIIGVIVKNDYIVFENLLPVANFTSNTTAFYLNDNDVQFTFTGFEEDSPSVFQWNFGDGTSNSTERNPIHSYGTIGNYTVTLTVNDTNGDIDVLTRTDYIGFENLLPIADFTANITTIYQDAGDVEFTFTGFEGDGILTYNWNFGDGTGNSTIKNPSHSYNSIGTYTVILMISEVNGDNDSMTKIDYITITNSTIPHSPIYIDGNTEMDIFFAGNATDGLSWSSAYIIENLTVNANGLASGIEIRNSDRYLIIRNCALYDSGSQYYDAGIELYYSNNVKIIQNSVYSNRDGISLYHSDNNTLINNNASNNNRGIYLYYSNNNTLTSNNASYNNDGIFLGDSEYSELISNNASNNNRNGIILDYSHYSLLFQNNASNNNYNGIYSDYSYNNEIIGNWFTFNKQNGIRLQTTHYFEIFGNNLSYNYEYGIRIISTSTFHNIYFNNIEKNVIDEVYSGFYGQTNKWDSGSLGNYWGNYTETNPESLNDGTVWDLPYIIGNEQDNFPLVQPYVSIDFVDFSSNNTTPVLYANTVQFYFTGVIYGSIKEFHWNFGDGTANSTDQNPIHVFESIENYTITLTVYNSTDIVGVVVKNDFIQFENLIPEANFSVDHKDLRITNNVSHFSYTGSEGDSPLEYQWNFGDGSVNSTERNPYHAFSSFGSYSITLTVVDINGDSDVIVKKNYIVYINLLPIANFTVDITISVVNQIIQFTYTGSGGDYPLNFQWNFGDGTGNSTNQNPDHTYLDYGIFTVTLTVTDLNGDANCIVKQNHIHISAVNTNSGPDPTDNPATNLSVTVGIIIGVCVAVGAAGIGVFAYKRKSKVSLKVTKDGSEIKSVSVQIETLSDLFKMSESVKIEDAAQLTGLNRVEFLNFLIDNRNSLTGLKIDGDFLTMNTKEDVNDFVNLLDEQFETWKNKEKSKVGKN